MDVKSANLEFAYYRLVEVDKGICYLSYEINKLDGYDFWMDDTRPNSKNIKFAILKVPENYQGDLWLKKPQEQVLTYNFNANLNVRFCAKYFKIFHVEDQRIVTEPLILSENVTCNHKDGSVTACSVKEKNEMEKEYADNLQAFKSAMGDDVVISIAPPLSNASITNNDSKSALTPGFDASRSAAAAAFSSSAASRSTVALASVATGNGPIRKVVTAFK